MYAAERQERERYFPKTDVWQAYAW